MMTKRKLSVADFLAMGEAGLFAPDERIELLDGEIYTASPPSSQHAGVVKRLGKLLEKSYGDRALVSLQDPLILNDYRLTEPDLALLGLSDTFYTERHPQAEDALLVVEVSRSSLAYDKTEKLPRYAEAGIPEVWIVDVDAPVLEVYLEPTARGYRRRTLFYPGEGVTPSAFSGDAGIVALL